jgi:hypothetical protein
MTNSINKNHFRIISPVLIAILITVSGCGNSVSVKESEELTLQQTLNRLIYAAKGKDKANMQIYIASDSVLDTDGFLEKSTNTEELIRRIKIRALTEVLLTRIEKYTVETVRDIDKNKRVLDIVAIMKNPQGPTEQTKMGFCFIRQDGKWKLTEIIWSKRTD